MKGRQERHIDSSLRHNATTPQRIIKVFSIQNKVAVEFYYYIFEYIIINSVSPALHIGICLMIRCGDGTMWRTSVRQEKCKRYLFIILFFSNFGGEKGEKVAIGDTRGLWII